MKPQEDVMFLALSSWISSQALWTASALDRSVSFSVQTISSLDRQEQETIGPRVTTPKAQSSLTPSSTSCERRQRAAIACRDSSLCTLLVEALVLAWAPFSSPKCVKST